MYTGLYSVSTALCACAPKSFEVYSSRIVRVVGDALEVTHKSSPVSTEQEGPEGDC